MEPHPFSSTPALQAATRSTVSFLRRQQGTNMAAVMMQDEPGERHGAIQAQAEPDTLLWAVHWLCAHHGVVLSVAALQAGLPRGKRLSPTLAVRVLEQAGIGAGWVRRHVGDLLSYLLPVALLRKDGGAFVLAARHGQGSAATYEVVLPEAGDGSFSLSADEMDELYGGHALLAKPRPRLDERAGPEVPESEAHWLFSTLWRYRRYYASAALAALLINVLRSPAPSSR
jgi:ATP-binding cassette subfamily C protein LapB